MNAGNIYQGVRIEGAHNVQLGNTYNYNKGPTVEDFLKALYVSDPFSDLSRIRGAKPRTEGTCKWLVESQDFKSWLAIHDTPILWIMGDPGSGKTVMSSFLVEELTETLLKSTPAIFAYYFIEWQIGSLPSSSAVLRGLLWHIFHTNRELFDLVKEDYRVKGDSLTEDIDALWMVMLRIAKGPKGPIYLLIDALDESDDSSRKRLLDWAEQLDTSTGVRMIITSRPEADITETAKLTGRIVRIDSSKTTRDVEKFINVKVAELSRRKSSFPPSFFDHVREVLGCRADGTFLWAALVLGDLAAARTVLSARKKLENLPQNLLAIYRRMLENLEDSEHETAILLLAWIVVTPWPLTVRDLAMVAALSGPDRWLGDSLPPADVLGEYADSFRACGVLVYVGPDGHDVHLIHHTVEEFLLQQNVIDRDSAMVAIVSTCWRYLSFRDFNLFQRGGNNQIRPRGRNIQEAIKANKFTQHSLATLFHSHFTPEYLAVEHMETAWDRRWDAVAAFINQTERLDSLPAVRDYWLIFFTQLGRLDVVRVLVSKGADITSICEIDKCQLPSYPWRLTCFGVAALCEKHDVVDLLLQKGFNVNAICDGESVLHAVAMAGTASMARFLVERGADVNMTNRDGQTALYIATQNNQGEIALRLLELGASLHLGRRFTVGYGNPDSKIPREWILSTNIYPFRTKRPIHSFCRTIGCLIELLNHPKNLSKRQNDRITKWTDSTSLPDRWNDPNIRFRPRFLDFFPPIVLENGALIDKEVSYGWRLLHFASSGWHIGAVNMLLDAGANIRATTRVRYTALHVAIGSIGLLSHYEPDISLLEERVAKMCQLLIRRGVDIEAKSSDEMTALHQVVMASSDPIDHWQKAKVLETLLASGADTKAVNKAGLTALHLVGYNESSSGSSPAFAKLLLDHGADLSHRDPLGRTPLFAAAITKNGHLVRYLIFRGADPTTMGGPRDSKYSQTTLHQVTRLLVKWHREQHIPPQDSSPSEKCLSVGENSETMQSLISIVFEMADRCLDDDLGVPYPLEVDLLACTNKDMALRRIYISVLVAMRSRLYEWNRGSTEPLRSHCGEYLIPGRIAVDSLVYHCSIMPHLRLCYCGKFFQICWC